ncbi:hypothetical protein [Iodobacter fluviatilis]|uniref:Uncharacterized protein n=1 Tax=Iodobacter fluviatilis TaxID=537 RepID=A0A377Q548_9NEIS|nr:hypothetical protein [Iodobacter fluviatilis]TCU84588.1 hypothetical protein EV682_109113 [Iodobacter fluviatilis]STQ90053.1 Uncharacterised protein [Iodobacter fluviatilis]
MTTIYELVTRAKEIDIDGLTIFDGNTMSDRDFLKRQCQLLVEVGSEIENKIRDLVTLRSWGNNPLEEGKVMLAYLNALNKYSLEFTNIFSLKPQFAEPMKKVSDELLKKYSNSVFYYKRLQDFFDF